MSKETAEVRYNYSRVIQLKIVGMMLFDSKNFQTYQDVIDPKYFTNPVLSDIVDLILKFYDKYKRVPQVGELSQELALYLGQNSRLPEEEYFDVFGKVLESGEEGKFEFVQDKAIEFAKHQAVGNALREGIALWNKRDYVSIKSQVDAALRVGDGGDDLGTCYYEDLDARIERRKHGLARIDVAIPTSLDYLDKKLGGGIAPGETGLIMGPTKRGKTIISVNFGVGALERGFNVAHYIMEGGIERLSTAYDSKISGVPKQELKDYSGVVKAEVEKFFARPRIGKLRTKFFPTKQGSIWKIESHLQQLKALQGFEPNLLIIDYLGLMTTSDRSLKPSTSSDRYFFLGEITKEVISLCQRYNLATWLLHQSTRASLKKKTVWLDDSADSIMPIQDVDLILTLSQTMEESEMEPEQMRLFIAGAREVACGSYVLLKLDKERVRVSELAAGDK